MKWPIRWDQMPCHMDGHHSEHAGWCHGSRTLWECVQGHHHYWLLGAIWHNWHAEPQSDQDT